MRDAVMQIIAQVINYKAGDQSGKGERQHGNLIALRPIQHADRQKRRRAVGNYRKQSHKNAYAVIFGIQAAARAEIANRQQFNRNRQKKHWYRS